MTTVRPDFRKFLHLEEDARIKLPFAAATIGISKISIEDVQNSNIEDCCNAIKQLWLNDEYKKSPSIATDSLLVNGVARIYRAQVQMVEDEIKMFWNREVENLSDSERRPRRSVIVETPPTPMLIGKKKPKKKKKPFTLTDDDFLQELLNVNIEEELRGSPNISRPEGISLPEEALPPPRRTSEHFREFENFEEQIINESHLQTVSRPSLVGPVIDDSSAIRQMRRSSGVVEETPAEVSDIPIRDVIEAPPIATVAEVEIMPPPLTGTVPKILPRKKIIKKPNLALNFLKFKAQDQPTIKCYTSDYLSLVFKIDEDKLPERDYPIEKIVFPEEALWSRPENLPDFGITVSQRQTSTSLDFDLRHRPSDSLSQIEQVLHIDQRTSSRISDPHLKSVITPRATGEFSVPIYQSTPIGIVDIPEEELHMVTVPEVIIPDVDADEKIKLRRIEIIRVVKCWSNFREITLEDIAKKPLTKKTVATAFYDVLVLCKYRYLKLIPYENSFELRAIEKGPELM